MRAAPWRGATWLAARYPESGLGFRLLMGAIDAGLSLIRRLCGARSPGVFPAVPRRVLVIATAHLGDVVIATSALRDLRRLHPRARLGIVIGSWSRAVIAGHPGIEWIHEIDHPRINRRERSWAARLRRFAATARTALPAIRAIGYDAVFDLQERHSLLPLVPAMGIVHRIGFGTGGWSALLTERVDGQGCGPHRADQHRRLVLRGDDARAAGWPRPAAWLPGDGADASGTDASVGDASGVDACGAGRAALPAGLPERYLLLHPGAGDPAKRWHDDAWTELAVRLACAGLPLVCVGQGADDRRMAARLREAGLAPVDLVDVLDFAQLARVVRRARAVICMDSVTAHLAAAADVPVVAITSGVAPAGRFAPLGAAVAVVTHPVACAPCHAFCPEVDCVRRVRPDSVARALGRLMKPAAPDALAAGPSVPRPADRPTVRAGDCGVTA